MKISASVFSNPDRQLEDLVQELEACGLDYLHVDCNDDPEVGTAIARMRKACSLPIDLHIISPDPEKFYPMIKEQGVELVTLQVEDLNGRIPEMPDLGCQWGLALTTNTPVEAFAPYADRCSFILFMATVPGQSGGKFDPSNFSRIREFRKAYPRKRIHVDGGVNAEISFVLRNSGVYCSVSGSFLVKAKSVPLAFLNLLVQKTENHLLVRDIMNSLDELPVLDPAVAGFKETLSAIEEYRMGYCLFRRENGELAGMTTNADLRRGMMEHLDDLNALKLISLVNQSPKTIREDVTVTEMLRYVKSLDFLVLYLPVVDGAGHLAGAVNFNNLILGEL